MTSVLALSLLLLADISLRVSPERALPIHYADEPVVVQLNDVPAGDYAVSGRLYDTQGQVQALELPPLSIAEPSPYYITLPTTLDDFGPYTLSLTLRHSDNTLSADTIFYRNHRPDHLAPTPLRMPFPNWNDQALTVALEVPLKEARVFLDHPNTSSAIDDLSRLETPIRAVAYRAQSPATEAQLESWVTAYRDRVDTWEFELGDDSTAIRELIQLLRQIHPNARVALRCNSPETWILFLSDPPRFRIHDVVLTETAPDVHRYQSVAQQAGLEHVAFSIENPNTTPSTIGASIIAPLNRFSPVVLDVPAIDTSSPTGMNALSLLNHWAEVLPQYEAVGPYYLQDTTKAYLYRSRTPKTPWLIAILSDTAQTLTLPQDLAVHTSLTHRFAPIPRANPQELPVGLSPVFLRGHDPAPIAQALRNALIQEASTLLAIKAYAEVLPQDIQDRIGLFPKATPETTFRAPFLELVRQFPELESRHHAGEIPTHIAIPLIARLASMTRIIAALEQLSGPPFLESHTTTLAKCNQFLAQYHRQGISHAPNTREARLLHEINRLMDETKALEARGLSIEATAVSTLAEWRARALLKRIKTP